MTRAGRRWALGLALGALTLAGMACRRADSGPELASTDLAPSGSLGPPPLPPPTLRGMVWIPPGALVAGTPPDQLPRIPDEEMPGEQVPMQGFHIDVFPFPNEEGAIPLTNVTQPEAQQLCAERQKRLCTELEWERACKGPQNLAYEYDGPYDPKRCATGALPRLLPSGIHVGCASGFGVRDLHGGVWEWTSSEWARGGATGLVTVRGGNSTAGELVARCANGVGRSPGSKSDHVGFRCCAGEPNTATVTLTVTRGTKLESRDTVDPEVASVLLAALPELARGELSPPGDFRFSRMWLWRPVGNESLVVLGGCAGIARQPVCGIVVARLMLGRARPLVWASSGIWMPQVYVDVDPRDLWLFGGDELGAFRALVGYVHGRISLGPRERRLPRPDGKRKRSGPRR